MEDKEQTQVEQETQTEEVKTQPTVEELQELIRQRDAEIERKENVIQQTKSENKRLQRMGGSEKVDALHKRLDDYQEFFAEALDEVVTRVSGEEEVRPQRQTYKERLQARKQPEPQVDPAAQRFFDYLAEESLDFDSDVVQETIKDTQTPQQALKAMKEKVKTMEKDKIKKEAEEEIKGMRQTLKEELIKELGLATQGAGAPSGGASTFAKLEDDYAEGKITYEEYKKARKEQGFIY